MQATDLVGTKSWESREDAHLYMGCPRTPLACISAQISKVRASDCGPSRNGHGGTSLSRWHHGADLGDLGAVDRLGAPNAISMVALARADPDRGLAPSAEREA